VFYNILHFIAYYPAITQLGFIFSRAFVSFAAPFELGAPGKVPLHKRKEPGNEVALPACLLFLTIFS
jgi:hypothetical protein